ncbi:hypothetical protein [Vibrio palustris]|uniref:hypothetical protein n=1 Tax=Vibrio palustris TaxID=1918946 RepID=UPI0011154994|nr:hypothetical protein [Vibrio palustris]
MRPATVRFSQPNRSASRRRNGFAYPGAAKKSTPRTATPVERTLYTSTTSNAKTTDAVKAA